MKAPNFICIGGQRCGSSWLHRQLTKHPKVWTTPVKELHYWNIHYAGKKNKARQHRQKLQIVSKAVRRIPYIAQHRARVDIVWLWRFLRGLQKGRTDVQWYYSLFPDDYVAGETTPAYELLEHDTLEDIARYCPQTRIIYTLRNPIDRIWSNAYKHLISRSPERISQTGNTQALLEQYLLDEIDENDARYQRGFYSRNIDRWQQYFPPEQMIILFFDEMCAEPENYFGKIEAFLGIDSGVLPVRDADYKKTRKSYGSAQDHDIPPRVRYHVGQFYRNEVWELAQRYGYYPQQWLDHIDHWISEITERA